MFNSVLLNKIMKKYKIKQGMKIEIKLINLICCKEKISIKDLKCMLQISDNTMYKLRNGSQKYTKLNFNKFDGIQNGYLLDNDKIDYKCFIELRNVYKIKDYTLMRNLGMSRYGYKKIKNDQDYKARTRDIKIKHIVDLIKIDLRYFDKSEYKSIKNIKIMCRRANITIVDFVKYYSIYPKHAEYNYRIVEESEKGYYMGNDKRIPKEFIEKYSEELNNRLEIVSYCLIDMIKSDKGSIDIREDVKQDAFIELQLKYGHIVRNFYFDIKLTFNILMKLAKYRMKNIYRKKYRNVRTMCFENFDNIFGDNLEDFNDIKYI